MTDGIRHAAGRRTASQRAAWRSAAKQCAGYAVVATVVPLSLAQVPFGGIPSLLGSGPAIGGGGLVLPFFVAAAPLAALTVRRSGAWTVMFGGLVLIMAGAAVALALPATAVLAGAVSALRGSGAGMALPATAALASGQWVPPRRPPRQRGHVARAGSARPPLAAWWAAVAVASLAVLPGLTRTEAAAGGWQTAFGPVPLLTAAALAAALAHRLLADRPSPGRRARDRAGSAAVRRSADLAGIPAADRVPTLVTGQTVNHAAIRTAARARGAARTRAGHPGAGRARDRAAFPAAQRAKIALLAPPAAALAVLAVGAAGRPGVVLAAVALSEAAVLLTLAAMMARGADGDGFAVACALAGFVLAPASVELLSLRSMAAAQGTGDAGGTVLAAAVIAGAALGACATLRMAPTAAAARSTPGGTRVAPHVRLSSVGGLLLAAGALVIGCFAGPFASTALLGLLAGAVVGGLTAALARPAGETTTAGALAGAVLLVSGILVGSLAAAAIRVELAAPGPVTEAGVITPSAPPGAHASVSASAVAGVGVHAIPSGLVAAYGWWALAGAAIAVAVALTRCARRAGAGAGARAKAGARTEAGPRTRLSASTRSRTRTRTSARTKARTPRRHARAASAAAGPAATPQPGAHAKTTTPRHVARGDRRRAKVRPVSG